MATASRFRYEDVRAFVEKVDLIFNRRCGVCLGPVLIVEETRVSHCGHAYHDECLDLWHAACTLKKMPVVCPDSCGLPIKVVTAEGECVVIPK
jgi:hypothetical protein